MEGRGRPQQFQLKLAHAFGEPQPHVSLLGLGTIKEDN